MGKGARQDSVGRAEPVAWSSQMGIRYGTELGGSMFRNLARNAKWSWSDLNIRRVIEGCHPQTELEGSETDIVRVTMYDAWVVVTPTSPALAEV